MYNEEKVRERKKKENEKRKNFRRQASLILLARVGECSCKTSVHAVLFCLLASGCAMYDHDVTVDKASNRNNLYK